MDSFVFYKSWKDAIAALPPMERLSIYEATIDYAIAGKEPDLNAVAMMAFNFIRQDIDRNGSKYEAIKQKRREAAKRSHEQKHASAANAASAADNVYLNGNVDVNGNDNVNGTIEDKSSVCVKEAKASNIIETDADASLHTNKRTQSFIFKAIMFRRGIENFEEEATAFEDHYECYGWKSQAGQPIKNRESAARAWKPKDPAKREKYWVKLYADMLDTMPEDTALELMRGYVDISSSEQSLTITFKSQEHISMFDAAITTQTAEVYKRIAKNKKLMYNIKN